MFFRLETVVEPIPRIKGAVVADAVMKKLLELAYHIVSRIEIIYLWVSAV